MFAEYRPLTLWLLIQNFTRFFIFVLCFTVDVHVHAEMLPNEKKNDPFEGILQEPEQCLKQNQNMCSVYLDKRNKYTHVIDPTHFYVLNHRGLLQQTGARALRLLEGELLVYTGPNDKDSVREKSIVVETHFTKIKIHGGRLIVKAQRAGATIYNIDADVTLSYFNGEETFVPKGSQVDVTRLGRKGVVQMEYPQSIVLNRFLKIWSKLSVYKSKQFKKEVAGFYLHWKDWVEKGALFHRKVIERRVAEAEKARLKRMAYRRKVEKENKELRNLLKRRNYLDY